MCPDSRARSTACTKLQDTTRPYMAQPRYHLNSQVLAIFFLSATITATSHYPEFTDRYSPQTGMLSFSLYFMNNTLFLTFFPPLPSQLHGWFSLVDATIPDPVDRILVGLPPPSLIHSPNLGCVGAQRKIFLGRFLV